SGRRTITGRTCRRRPVGPTATGPADEGDPPPRSGALTHSGPVTHAPGPPGDIRRGCGARQLHGRRPPPGGQPGGRQPARPAARSRLTDPLVPPPPGRHHPDRRRPPAARV